MQLSVEPGALLGVGAIITLFVVTLGPIKILGPFAQATHDADDRLIRQIAFRAFLLSVATVVLGSYVGVTLLQKWHVSVPALELSGGMIFLIVGLRIVLEQYHPGGAPPPAALPASPTAAALRLTFPTIVTPYGIAAVMVLLAKSPAPERTSVILIVLVAVMALNLLFMIYARKIMSGITIMILRILGSVLGVLQVALAVELILRSLHDLGLINVN